MKRKYTSRIGNVLMGAGVISMVGGFVFSILSYAPEIGISSYHGQFAIIAIFLGAFIWLVGARLSGIDRISDRYWAIRHFDHHYKVRGGQVRHPVNR